MKIKRHSMIIELINEFDIETQDELAERLRESGFEVTQATVSRDIRELMLTKTVSSTGRHKYVVMGLKDKHVTDRLIRVFKESVIALDFAQNMVIVKTLAGTAQAVAAGIDAINYPECVGSLAGDDIIFCATKNNEKAISLLNKIKNLISTEDR